MMYNKLKQNIINIKLRILKSANNQELSDYETEQMRHYLYQWMGSLNRDLLLFFTYSKCELFPVLSKSTGVMGISSFAFGIYFIVIFNLDFRHSVL
jgi:hypothetical protein